MKKFVTLILPLSVVCTRMFCQNDSIELLRLQDITSSYANTKPDSSIYYGFKGLKIAEGDDSWSARFNNEISIAYRQMGDYDKAMSHGVKGLELSRRSGRKRLIISSLLGVGSVQNRLRYFESANSYYRQAIDLALETTDTALIGKAYMNLATGQLQQQKLDSSITNFKTAMTLFQQVMSVKGMASCAGNLGVAYYYKEDYQSSIKYGKMTIKNMRELGNLKGVAQATYNVGSNYRILEQYDSARVYLQSCLKLAQEQGWLTDILNSANALSLMEESLGNYKASLEYHRLEEDIEDSLFNDRSVQASIEMERKYQAKQKDLTISELARKEAEANAAKKQQAIWLIVIGSGLVVTLVLTLLFVVRQRGKRREREALFAQQRIELEHHALRARMNPHFLFNALSGIQHLYVNGKTKEASEFMSDFSLLLRKILEHTGRAEVTLKEEVETLELYLRIEQRRLEQALTYHFDIDESLDLPGIQVPPMVIQPFVENSIWHGIVPNGSGNILITLKHLDNNNIHCTIEDDGVGLSKAKATEHDSKGMRLAEQRLAGDVQISERVGGGTIVQIQIPGNS